MNITWANTDGIHLGKFEYKNSYDFVISNVVIEHIHPDDLAHHFKGAYEILAKGGKYIFSTPHKFYGPTDISNVFGMEKPKGMHLKEYMVFELVRKLRKAGFKKIYFPYRIYTKKFYKLVPYASHEIAWIGISERILNIFSYRIIKMILKFEKRILNIPTIYLVAEK
jgi:SAM-dependent methyltransferase